jgi:hypothetical protein
MKDMQNWAYWSVGKIYIYVCMYVYTLYISTYISVCAISSAQIVGGSAQ